MTRLFYAIASPKASINCGMPIYLYDRRANLLSHSGRTLVTQTIQALEGLEMAALTHSILRRYHLTRLIEHRIEREKSHVLQRINQVEVTYYVVDWQIRTSLVASTIWSDGWGLLALSDLMAEAYLKLKQLTRLRDAAGTEYERRHKSVKNMLGAGTNWYSMQQAFSPGILALVPTSQDRGIQNSK
jgi:hypothetical protein